MKIGVYINDFNPVEGGTSSLIKTIKDELLASKTKDEFCFIFNGSSDKPYKISSGGFDYFNLDACGKPPFFFRLCRKLLSFIGIKLIYDKHETFNSIAKKERVDLYWLTFPCAVDIDYPYIYTVWDLGHRSAPFFPEVSRAIWLWDDREATYQKMLYKASYILTGNEAGKKEILENYPVREDKIKISEFPVASFCHGSESKPSFDTQTDFFFYPAQFWAHKNHIRIVQALKILKDKHNECPNVIFTGSDKGNKDYISSEVKRLGLQDQVIFAGFVSDEEMKYLYKHAKAMIFASLLGPNNMPPIEATYLGCPVIITDLDGHKEQLKDTALYFDGCDAGQLAECMHKMLKDAKLKKKLLQKQKKLAVDFGKVNYFEKVQNIIDEFRPFRETWGEDFIPT